MTVPNDSATAAAGKIAEAAQKINLALIATCVAALALGLQGARYIPDAAKAELELIAPSSSSDEDRALQLWEKLSVKMKQANGTMASDGGTYRLRPHYRLHVKGLPPQQWGSVRREDGDLVFSTDSLNWAIFSNVDRQMLNRGVQTECIHWPYHSPDEVVRENIATPLAQLRTRAVFRWTTIGAFQRLWDANNRLVPITVPMEGEGQFGEKSLRYEIKPVSADSDWTRDEATLNLTPAQVVGAGGSVKLASQGDVIESLGMPLLRG